MQAEWSAECSAEDPVLIVPWKDPGGTSAFVDLRANPYDFDAIPEADRYPQLMHALRALNATRSPVFTAKCDAWLLDDTELGALHLDLDIDPSSAVSGFASYIDILARDRAVFASFPRHEQMLRRLVRNASSLEHPVAALDCVLRPALTDFEGPRQGFAISLYVKAAGHDFRSAFHAWAAALESVVALVRGKDFLR
jgi:hypothetical protein